ncbi:transferase, Chloramphenicol acetyltransferase-like domain protein [Artemisia annua]|uniref:Transferase, Chloramphenicol acetyltransferase-like domain protein n=1 Tax=Artemisia annua TaxID=35608 RepID=A0A2U1QIT4_ARTAN|nr:transferase, Chloramphenicol acetyltransferase-like domain protein [Artemisia annua]
MMMNIEKQSSKLIKPLVPTPQTLRHYKISFTDEIAPFISVSVVLFFSANSNAIPKFVSRLETSLEKILTRFYPLAGRYMDKTQTIDCNDQGAEFIHAKVDIKMQDIFAPCVDVKFVDEFIPTKKFAVEQFTDPLLAIQVTMFKCGGVALGASTTHKIADASTLSTFLNEWAAMNREENEIEFSGPGFNSPSLFPGRCHDPVPLPLIHEESSSKLYIRKKVSFSESEISILKEKAMANGKINTIHLSKVQLVSAIIWKAFISVANATNNKPSESILVQPVDLRGKTASLIPKNSCGNLIGLCATDARMVETTEELADRLSHNVKKTINTLAKVNHCSEEGQTAVLNSLTLKDVKISESTNVIFVTSWCKIPFYQADFGFGKPTWAAPECQPLQNHTTLMDDAQGNGVDAHVLLEVKNVPYFEEVLKVDPFLCKT